MMSGAAPVASVVEVNIKMEIPKITNNIKQPINPILKPLAIILWFLIVVGTVAIVVTIIIGVAFVTSEFSTQEPNNNTTTNITEEAPEPYKQEWGYYSPNDPITDIPTIRATGIGSSNGECVLEISKDISGYEASAIYCHSAMKLTGEFTSDEFKNSKRLEISGRHSWDIKGNEYAAKYKKDSGYISYSRYISVIRNNTTIAFKTVSGSWIKFNLKGSSAALNKLGEPK